MSVRMLRQRKHLSQEQLAETCGLSLRTIQRVERGHRVSYSSLRALAAVFETDIDTLEQELYAMDNMITKYEDYPFLVRFACGRGWFSASRRELQKIEIFALFFSAFGIAVWLGSFSFDALSDPTLVPGIKTGDFFGLCGVACLFCAYSFSVSIRVGDKYDVWSKLEATQPGGIFGLFR